VLEKCELFGQGSVSNGEISVSLYFGVHPCCFVGVDPCCFVALHNDTWNTAVVRRLKFISVLL
jgi:hypothetical protein